MNTTAKRLIGTALVAVSLLPLSNGAGLFASQMQFMQESIERPAIVVDHVQAPPKGHAKNTNAVYAVVEFTDDNGVRRTQPTNVASYPPQHVPGDELTIRYHQQNADDVREVSFNGLWFESMFYLIPGLLTFALGLWLSFRR